MKTGTKVLSLLSISTAAWMASPVPTAAAEPVTVTPLLSKEVANEPGKEIVMISVEYEPGAQDPVHRHHAQAVLYVLEGNVEMQVKGGPLVKLGPGGTFYEGADDVHTVGRNGSTTKPARFIVVLLKDKGAPILVPE